ncbi:hypothetical protein LCM10_09130 [Rossellomorea aquimaris]|uniref:hypothetical protein n=1 Tax=Rossellomorea aquimaris TaxID=189382 RepID=UPI001CD6FC21|nr:hypothetical protein [Rossellomorea aquimaris]MCA1055149.1 hypothetical protein [Rossellomorea aquimaris]
MLREIKMFKGLKDPSFFFYNLSTTENLKGYAKNLLYLILLSALVFGLISSFGLGMDSLSKELNTLSPASFELEKFLFFMGRVLTGIFYSIMTLFIPSVIFWTISEQGEYRKLVIVQGLVLLILLLEKLTYIPLSLFLSLDWFSSPLSLGVIAQYLTMNEWVMYFLGSFSLFKIWIFYIQYKGLKRLTEQKNWLIWTVILLTNLFFWAITAFLAYIDFSTLL